MPINKCFSSFSGEERGAKNFATCLPQRWFCNSPTTVQASCRHGTLPPKLFTHFHFHLFTHCRRLPCSTFPLHLLCIIGMEIRFLVMTYGIIHDWITSLTAVVTKVTNMCARLSKLGSSGTKPWNVGLFPSSPSNRLKREEIFSSCANTGGRRWHFE